MRVYCWSRQGISLAGPLVAETFKRRDAAPQNPVAGRAPSLPQTLWLIGIRAPAEQITADIARAVGAAGFVELARATDAARPRNLSGNPVDIAAQLPGIRVPGSL